MNGYDLVYALGVGLAAPYWLLRPAVRRKVLAAFGQRMGKVAQRSEDVPAVMIHAVSLGEMNATRSLVAELGRRRADLHFIISSTTETGFARGRELYGDDPRVMLIRYPLDFSAAVGRVLERLRPSVVVLMELEAWPNFLKGCEARGVPVVLVNGRLTEPSYRRYRWGRPVTARMFRRLNRVCVQEQRYADWFIGLGVPAERVRVTGTMKFDTAAVGARVEGDDALAAAVGLRRGREPIWVSGSTGPGEEQIVLEAYRRLLEKFEHLRLVIVPRKPERFDEVAGTISEAGFAVIRRSHPGEERRVGWGPSPPPGRTAPNNGGDEPRPTHLLPPVVLGDTMGELRKFYSLADVVFVGRTLLDLGPRQHGSDMIEPAALGRPVIVGPFTANFAEAMSRFRAARAVREVLDASQLQAAVASLLSEPVEAAAMGNRARQIVRQEQGATERHVKVVLEALERVTTT